MYTIAVANQKGGVGKSTVVANLAVSYTLVGQNVLTIDADVQGSMSHFHATRMENEQLKQFTCVQITEPVIHKQLRTLTADIVIIDVGGKNDALLRSAIKSANLLILPLQYTQFDLEASLDVLEYFEQEVALRDDVQCKMLLNRVVHGVSDTDQMTGVFDNIHQDYHVSAFKTQWHNRAAFYRCISTGQNVCEYEPGGKACNEVNSLIDEINDLR